jgi:hypothetical protein
MAVNPRSYLSIPASETCAVRTIVPSMARELLTLNTTNRQMMDARCRFLAKQMTEGKFRFNGDAIRFGGGKLLDGQHRLQACLLAGVPFKTLVVVDLDESDCYDTIDGARRRSFADRLHVAGEANVGRLSSIVSAHLQLRSENFVARGERSARELMDWLATYPGLRDAVSWYNGKETAFRQLGCGRAYIAALWYEFGTRDAALRDEFFEALETGVGLAENGPILALRNRLVANAASRTKLTTRDLVALWIKAWNYHRAGSSCGVLRWTREGRAAEPFPTIE